MQGKSAKSDTRLQLQAKSAHRCRQAEKHRRGPQQTEDRRNWRWLTEATWRWGKLRNVAASYKHQNAHRGRSRTYLQHGEYQHRPHA